MTNTDWELIKIELYKLGRLSDRQELSDAREQLEELILELLDSQRAELVNECIAVLINSTPPGNEQMKGVRALRALLVPDSKESGV